MPTVGSPISEEAQQTPTPHPEETRANEPSAKVETLEDLHRIFEELTSENARLTEAVAARDTFLAVAAHELRNPITPIVGRLEILCRRLATASKEQIEWSLDQLDFLVSQFVRRSTTLLDVSRLTSGRGISVNKVAVEVGRVAELVAENFRPLAILANCEMKLDFPPGGVTIIGDRLAIEQIIDNLVSNAIKYAGGHPITIKVTADSGDNIAHIAVSDNGPGISQENAERIFERFERAIRPGEISGGFGVGLWVVKQLCEAMDGSIEIMSNDGGGSTFRITLPLANEKGIE